VLNPLTAMKILVEVAGESGEAASLKGQDLIVLHQEIMRMENLVQTFLDFARPPQPDMRIVDAKDLVDRTVSLVSSRSEQQGVQIEIVVPAVPVVVRVDPGQIRQVILNLLMNALDATKSGGAITIVLSWEGQSALQQVPARNGSAHEPWVKLCVCDTGPGLPRELGQRIFDPFVSTKETGIGLGLSICARIMDAHGGRILATNGPEKGALFTLLLPPLEKAATESPGERQATNALSM
jgi:two-component system sensor histidine kinase HydH